MALTFENCAGLNGEGRRFDIAKNFGMTLKFDAFGGVNVPVHHSVDDRGGDEDVRLDFRGFTYD